MGFTSSMFLLIFLIILVAALSGSVIVGVIARIIGFFLFFVSSRSKRVEKNNFIVKSNDILLG